MDNNERLNDFAKWLWDIDALKLNNQIPPFETPEMMVKFYIKANEEWGGKNSTSENVSVSSC